MTLARDLAGIHAIWLREFTVFKREKSRVVSALATPLMWIFLFGSGLGAMVDPDATGGTGFQPFIFPGILLMGVLFQSMFFGLYIVWDRKIDVLRAVLVAPVSRPAVFFGKVLGGCTDVTIQAAFLLAIGAFIVPSSQEELVRYLLVYPIGLLWVLLVAICLVSLGLTLGSFFESLEGFQVFISFLAFPMFFLSGAIYSLEGLPPWLGSAVYGNPLTYGVDGLRAIILPGREVIGIGIDLLVVVVWAFVMILLGSWAFRRMR